MSRTIYTIGETVYDILFSDGRPVASTPGGSMLNSSVSLGRLGIPVHFISEYGCDHLGNLIDQFLTSNGVNTSGVYRYPNRNSSLALAFLDEHRNADYSFYKEVPPQRLAVEFPEVREGDIVAFGSFYGISPEIHTRIAPFLRTAKDKGALIYYDPNFRKPHLHELEQLRPILSHNFAIADMVRASDEDMELIFGVKGPEEAWELLKEHTSGLIYTSSDKAAWWFSAQGVVKRIPPSIRPVSTVGAGDTFNAGMLSGLLLRGVHLHHLTDLDPDSRAGLMDFALRCASEVCLSYDNYISESFAQSVR